MKQNDKKTKNDFQKCKKARKPQTIAKNKQNNAKIRSQA